MSDTAKSAIPAVIQIMQAQLRGLTLEDVARALRFDKRHLAKVFRKVTGLPPGQFHLALRVQEAKRLLLNTSLPVGVISHRVGYDHPLNFAFRFKRNTGVTPSRYRQLAGRLPAVAAEAMGLPPGDAREIQLTAEKIVRDFAPSSSPTPRNGARA